MGIFETLDNLTNLRSIFSEIWYVCLDYPADENEQINIENALQSIEAGMIEL